MRQIFIHMAAFGVVGGVLAFNDIMFYNWSYWAIILSMLVVQLNAGMD